MPATVTTRAITFHLRKRRADQAVENYRERRADAETQPVREALATWITGIGEELADAEPDMPDGVADRPAETWEPLLAIADAAGGDWPDIARAACLHFVGESTQAPTSLGVRLLADLHAIFTRRNADRLATKDLLAELWEIDDGRWTDMEGKPLNDRRMSKELRKYLVAPAAFNDGTGTVKGYVTYPTYDSAGEQVQVGLADAWSRYLSSSVGNVGNVGNLAGQSVTDTGSVTATVTTSAASSGAHPLTGGAP
ncbi:DUF3631 domain-containing protein [Kutzneria sp. 744]|uniref:DUF3631 domain-containing protein n=1 Tax=Kutzneria sp. (strain 744) TaxID=345341 RepID=UPI0003EECA64|nr:DUF3631 domain-containing protein [Kutzneria sp. 744]EWM19229.1 hypothetical protein KUTG_09533 [Kutzneria sp. 744]